MGRKKNEEVICFYLYIISNTKCRKTPSQKKQWREKGKTRKQITSRSFTAWQNVGLSANTSTHCIIREEIGNLVLFQDEPVKKYKVIGYIISLLIFLHATKMVFYITNVIDGYFSSQAQLRFTLLDMDDHQW